MTTAPARLRAVRDLIETRLGISFPDEQLDILATRLRSLTARTGLHSQDESLQALLLAPERWLPVALPDLVIGETWFLRQRPQFEALRQEVVPSLLATLPADAPLTLWSAGCSTGEEPYSLALWLREHFPSLWPHRLRVVATDVNPAALAHAQTRRYGDRAIRHLDPELQRRSFTSNGAVHELNEDIATVVRFSEHNLVSGALPLGIAPGSISVIFCRNVLLYFSNHTRDAALALFRQALAPGGVLMLGHADFVCTGSDWCAHYRSGCFFHRRSEDEPSPRPAPPRPRALTPATVPMPWPPSPPIPMAQARPPETAVPAEVPAVDPLAAARDAANRGELARARTLLAEHTASNRTSTEGHYLAGLVADHVGELELARRALKASLFLDRGLVMGHLMLGLVLEQQRDPRAAARSYRAVRQLLDGVPDAAPVPLGDGFTAGRVREMAELRLSEVSTEAVS